MARNTVTRLRCRRASMSQYDRLPADLRQWLATAALPWSAQSALRLWQRSLRTARGDTHAARAALDRAEARLVARDAALVWGPSHPAALLAQPRE
ncbi:MAG: hypothetical protein EA407_09940 [Rhodobacteraceae bacterium]|nr:MAG: hypothetical protein EA407_09940 [Paracoccaceae bacterium]